MRKRIKKDENKDLKDLPNENNRAVLQDVEPSVGLRFIITQN